MNGPPARLIRVTLLVAGITILALLLLTRTEMFGEFEASARDAQARLLSPRESDRIVLVEVDDTDYATLFGGVSPLAPAVVLQVLQAILAGGPRAVGVDLETSSPRYRDAKLPGAGTPVIWARDAVPSKGGLVPLDYLGGRETEPFGLITYETDHGGAIRRYQRWFETTGGPMPSFATAIGDALTRKPSTGVARDTRQLSIEFRRGTPLTLHPRTILAWAADSTSAYRTSGPLHNRIVLLGGHYRAARDEHSSPFGELSGVEILAQTLETDLDGHGRPPPSPAILLLLQSLTVLLLVALFVRLSFSRAFFLAVVALPLIALLGGWVATGVALTGFAYFLPLLIVILIEILYEKVIEYREELMVELVGRKPGRH